MSANPNQILSSTVAFMFLDETLHTKKKKKKTRRVSDQSESSDIEMKKQGSGERTETDDSEIEMNGTASLIAESDIDQISRLFQQNHQMLNFWCKFHSTINAGGG